MSLAQAYKDRLASLRQAAQALREFIEEQMDGEAVSARIDIVTARAKGPESFLKKAERYSNPLEDIQDQIGVRVVVFYLSDVDPVRDLVKRFFHAIEDKKAGVTGTNVFGYEAWHCILQVPPHIQQETKVPVEFFELQVATLFQHAWAQANHDITYKSAAPLSDDLKRDSAWAAAQAYGADKVFERLLDATRSAAR